MVTIPVALLTALFVLTAVVTTIACIRYIWFGTKTFEEDPEDTEA
jgi:hypothetical protein